MSSAAQVSILISTPTPASRSKLLQVAVNRRDFKDAKSKRDEALSRKGQDTPVSEVMRQNFTEVDSHDMVESALMRLQENGSKTLPVVHNGQLVGLLTSENVTEYLMIRSALRTAGGIAYGI